MATGKLNLSNLDDGELSERFRALSDELQLVRGGGVHRMDEPAPKRGVPAHRTRERAKARVVETLAALDREIEDKLAMARFLLATQLGPLDTGRCKELGALLVAREKLEPLLVAKIDEPVLAGEHDPWRDDDVRRIASLEAELSEIRAELDKRLDKNRLLALDEQRAELAARIGA